MQPPTPIGLPQPSLHVIELPNYSDAPLEFQLELEELHALNQQSHGFPELACARCPLARSRLGSFCVAVGTGGIAKGPLNITCAAAEARRPRPVAARCRELLGSVHVAKVKLVVPHRMLVTEVF